MSPASNLLSSESSDSFKFPKLNGSNYASWVSHMKSALQSKYLWLIVTGDEECLPDAAADAKERVGFNSRPLLHAAGVLGFWFIPRISYPPVKSAMNHELGLRLDCKRGYFSAKPNRKTSSYCQTVSLRDSPIIIARFDLP